jgi:hypothetical protein
MAGGKIYLREGDGLVAMVETRYPVELKGVGGALALHIAHRT